MTWWICFRTLPELQRRASITLIKLSQKREEEKNMLQDFSYKVSITLILKSDKKQQQQQKITGWSSSCTQMQKFSMKYMKAELKTTSYSHSLWSNWFIKEMREWFNICILISVSHHIKGLKYKNHIMILIDNKHNRPLIKSIIKVMKK